jgi:putative DNA primase/helicase
MAVPDSNFSAFETEQAPGPERHREVVLTRASSLRPEPVHWLWNEWIARGKLHLIAGAPGTGKTTISLGVAATISSGGSWPDGTKAPIGEVLVWSGEDDPADVIVPRLAAAGANLDRIHIVSGIDEDGRKHPFDPAKDFDALAQTARKLQPALLILDPIIAVVAGNAHQNGEVRRALQPVVDFASAMRCAVLGVTHFSKGTQGRDPTERVTGSIGFAALARVVMATAAPPEPGAARRLVRTKSNIGLDGGGFTYELRQVHVPGTDIDGQTVFWGDALEGSARSLLAEVEVINEQPSPAVAAAIEFLRSALSDGPVRSTDVLEGAKVDGHSEATIKRARKALGVVPKRVGGAASAGYWVWHLADAAISEPEMKR